MAYWHAIRLGKYEAASDALLYEYDADYRRRKAKERIVAEQGLGASIRRLRKQRGHNPGRLHAKSLAKQDFLSVGVVPAGDEAFVLDADLEGAFVFQQGQRGAP